MRNDVIDSLISQSITTPDKPAYIILEDGERLERKITFLELYTQVKTLSSELSSRNLRNKHAVLVYQNAADFTVAFLSCLAAEVVAVPLYFSTAKKHRNRLINVLQDIQATVLLTSLKTEGPLREILGDHDDFRRMPVIVTDGETNSFIYSGYATTEPSDIAFIQYTSGSTGFPKGVIISKDNLNHNQLLLQQAFQCDENSVLFSWLPFYHDMGLIGNILHSVYAGCTCIMMSPNHFIGRPQRWLEAISTYKVTHSGGPNFAYDLCVRQIPHSILQTLDLSSWKVAYNGAEPIKADTLERFSLFFAMAGFAQEAFYPCYGMAEATLLVAGFKDPGTLVKKVYIEPNSIHHNKFDIVDHPGPFSKLIVSSGQVARQLNLKIINYYTNNICAELEEGEICVSGESITKGYWNRSNEEMWYELSGERYLRTGDLGFLHQGELFVNGRLKEILIIRGENYYPYDIEQTISQEEISILTNGVAVFSAGLLNEDFVVVAEIKRDVLRVEKDLDAIIVNIENAVVNAFTIMPTDVLLVSAFSIPKTSSGKLQRLRCRSYYQDGKFNVLAAKKNLSQGLLVSDEDTQQLSALVKEKATYGAVAEYLVHLIALKAGKRIDIKTMDCVRFTDLGVDSLRSMELLNQINQNLGINLTGSQLLHTESIADLASSIEHILWLKNEQTSGEDIII